MTIQQLLDLLNKVTDKNADVQLQIRLTENENMELVVAKLKAAQEYSNKIALYGESDGTYF